MKASKLAFELHERQSSEISASIVSVWVQYGNESSRKKNSERKRREKKTSSKRSLSPQWCTCFHSFNHFWCKSTVRNSMVIFCLPSGPLSSDDKAGVAFDVRLCLSKQFCCLLMMVVFCRNANELKMRSEQWQIPRRRLCRLCSHVQYDLWNQRFTQKSLFFFVG